ncbi:PEP/pyruvate-binding domain-containing protein [Escherichia coli]
MNCWIKTDIDDVTQLAKAGTQIRQWIIDTPFQPELENAIRKAYAQLSADDENASFAVRSSATAEDMRHFFSRSAGKPSSTFRVLTPFSWQ